MQRRSLSQLHRLPECRLCVWLARLCLNTLYGVLYTRTNFPCSLRSAWRCWRIGIIVLLIWASEEMTQVMLSASSFFPRFDRCFYSLC